MLDSTTIINSLSLTQMFSNTVQKEIVGDYSDHSGDSNPESIFDKEEEKSK